MTRGIIIADIHLDCTREEHPSYSLAKMFARDFKPDFVVDLGDTLDLAYFASFNKENITLLGSCNWEDDVSLLNRELDWWQDVTSEYFWMQGNHDYRAEVIGEKLPAFSKSLDYESRFDLRERGITYVKVIDQPYKHGSLHYLHGWYCNKYHANKHLNELSGNCVYGHVHKFQSDDRHLRAEDKYITSQSLGCLSEKQPEYKKGATSHFENGFAIVYMRDDGKFWLYPVRIFDDSFIWDGREWRL